MSIENQVKGLNKWDTYPVVSTIYSGPLRIIASAIQIVAGALLAIVSALFGWINGSDIWKQDIAINATEVLHGIGNLTRGMVALVPGLGNLLIYLYDKSPLGTVVLSRDSDGLYTLPQGDIPGFSNMGTVRGRELNIRSGNFVIDTANRIVPRGWVLLT
jgi:hypothetical protein